MIGPGVGLRVTSEDVAITRGVQCRRRILFWRKRWHTTVLASTTHTIKAGDMVRLEQHGDNLVATVNDAKVLSWPLTPNAMRYKGFGFKGDDTFVSMPNPFNLNDNRS